MSHKITSNNSIIVASMVFLPRGDHDPYQRQQHRPQSRKSGSAPADTGAPRRPGTEASRNLLENVTDDIINPIPSYLPVSNIQYNSGQKLMIIKSRHTEDIASVDSQKISLEYLN